MEQKLSIQHCKNLGILKTGEKRGVFKLLACTVYNYIYIYIIEIWFDKEFYFDRGYQMY